MLAKTQCNRCKNIHSLVMAYMRCAKYIIMLYSTVLVLLNEVAGYNLGLGTNMILSYIMILNGHDNYIIVIFKISYYHDRQYIVFCVEIELLFV